MPRGKRKNIRMQQVLSRDGTVYSMQSIDLQERHRHRLSPQFLLLRYYRLIRTFTCSVIRPVETSDGVEFRLLTSRLALLSFRPPVYRDFPGGGAVDLCINGGFLVQSGECHRGRFSFCTETMTAGVRVTVQLSDYCPLLLGSRAPSLFRKTLYRFTQAYIHKVVTVRYLIDLYRELTGEDAAAKVEKVRGREGEDI